MINLRRYVLAFPQIINMDFMPIMEINLTELINYYTAKGFELPDPDDKKLLEWRK